MRLNKEPAGGRIGAVVWRGRRQRFGRVRHQRTIAGRIEQNKNAACGFCSGNPSAMRRGLDHEMLHRGR